MPAHSRSRAAFPGEDVCVLLNSDEIEVACDALWFMTCRSSADDTQQQVRGAHEANLCTAVPRRTHDRGMPFVPGAQIFSTCMQHKRAAAVVCLTRVGAFTHSW